MKTADGLRALAHGLEERDDGGHGDVERVGLTGHRDAHAGIGGGEPVVAEAVLFAAHDEGERAAEIGRGVERVGGGRGGDGADRAGLQPSADRGAGGDGDGHRKEHARGGAYDVGIEEIGDRIAHDEGVHAGGVGAAEDGAEITGFFDGLYDEEKGRGGERKVVEGVAPLGGDGEETVGALAVGDFSEGGLGEFEKASAGGLGLSEEGGLVFAEIPSGGVIELGEGNIFFQSAADLAVAFDEEDAGLVAGAAVAQFHQLFDARILEAGDEFDGHEGDIP